MDIPWLDDDGRWLNPAPRTMPFPVMRENIASSMSPVRFASDAKHAYDMYKYLFANNNKHAFYSCQ
ncbi:hypothetical protein ABC383_24310 [Noviherbaspirillum sp. 1P10PC]|uniref:hypothetical protein n=1 Tax=Noviherbaspirillum sp. 1P10PC TaxID=3132292 RepID=UPI0039A084B5